MKCGLVFFFLFLFFLRRATAEHASRVPKICTKGEWGRGRHTHKATPILIMNTRHHIYFFLSLFPTFVVLIVQSQVWQVLVLLLLLQSVVALHLRRRRRRLGLLLRQRQRMGAGGDGDDGDAGQEEGDGAHLRQGPVVGGSSRRHVRTGTVCQ